MRTPVRLSARLLALALLAPAAAAQIDLPTPKGAVPKTGSDGKTPTGNLVPHLVCSVCWERNYTTKIEYDAENGLQKAWCSVCRSVRLHHIPNRKDSKGGGIDLPHLGRRPVAPPRAAEVDRPADAPNATQPSRVTAAHGQASNAAIFVFEEVGRASRIDDPLALHAAESLLALGEPGLAAARARIASDHAPTMMVSLRVLLRSGQPEDADQVVMRIKTRMPTKAAAASVAELVARDPVRATPRLLCSLIDHPQSPVRAAAHRTLSTSPGPECVPFLQPALASKSSDARGKAVDLLARIDDRASVDLLLDAMSDDHASVAWRAVSAVARSADPRVELELLTRAFGDRWLLRENVYAILCLIELEDRELRPILHEGHVPTLVQGLESSDPLIAGTCAAALAGIGFRSPDPETTPWLDDRVPGTLVAVVAGYEYFDDHESVKSVALRRLKQISGVSYGGDGPGWAKWWLANADTFRSSRAVVTAVEGDETSLRVHYRDADGGAFVLLAPDVAEVDVHAREGEVFYISAAEARDFVTLLRGEGVFGIERLPGVRGGRIESGRTLDIRIADQGKSFVYGPGVDEPWFDRVGGMARSLRDRNLWQRFPDPERHGTRRVLYLVDGEWWAGDHTERERGMRLKQLVFDQLAGLAPEAREHGLVELERIYEDDELVDAADFVPLLVFLGQEVYYADRAERFAELARQAAGLREGGTPDETAVARASNMIGILHDRFQADAAMMIGSILMTCGDTASREAAEDERPLIRAIAAAVLARDPDEEDTRILLSLLEDPSVEVEIETVLALGRARVEVARSALIVRSRLAEPAVRSAALRALGSLGGDDARELLTRTLTDPDDRFRVPAAEGIAELGDPETIPVLVMLLRGGSRSATYPAARRGLLDIGEPAFEELFHGMRSPSPELRRECALLLARQRVPRAANGLIRVLAEDPTDSHVAYELCVLSCIDQRPEADPAEAWWRWWDAVRHEDARAWFIAACETRGMGAPPPDHFVDGGTKEAIAFLMRTMRGTEPWLVDRAQRELESLVGRELGDVPPVGAERELWLLTLFEVLTANKD